MTEDLEMLLSNIDTLSMQLEADKSWAYVSALNRIREDVVKLCATKLDVSGEET